MLEQNCSVGLHANLGDSKSDHPLLVNYHVDYSIYWPISDGFHEPNPNYLWQKGAIHLSWWWRKNLTLCNWWKNLWLNFHYVNWQIWPLPKQFHHWDYWKIGIFIIQTFQIVAKLEEIFIQKNTYSILDKIYLPAKSFFSQNLHSWNIVLVGSHK